MFRKHEIDSNITRGGSKTQVVQLSLTIYIFCFVEEYFFQCAFPKLSLCHNFASHNRLSVVTLLFKDFRHQTTDIFNTNKFISPRGNDGILSGSVFCVCLLHPYYSPNQYNFMAVSFERTHH